MFGCYGYAIVLLSFCIGSRETAVPIKNSCPPEPTRTPFRFRGLRRVQFFNARATVTRVGDRTSVNSSPAPNPNTVCERASQRNYGVPRSIPPTKQHDYVITSWKRWDVAREPPNIALMVRVRRPSIMSLWVCELCVCACNNNNNNPVEKSPWRYRQNGGPGGGAGRCQLPYGHGEEQVYAGGEGQQKDYTAGSKVCVRCPRKWVKAFASIFVAPDAGGARSFVFVVNMCDSDEVKSVGRWRFMTCQKCSHNLCRNVLTDCVYLR